MTFTLTESIIKAIIEIAGITIDLANPFTAANGILKALIKIGYLIVLLATLIKCIQDMFKFLISPVKYHAGMYVRDLMSKACEFLNMTFQSDIWAVGAAYYNEFVIPEKLYNAPVGASLTSGVGLFGFLTPDLNEQVGWYKGTFAKLLDAMKTKYNAKIVVLVPPGGVTPTNQGTVVLMRKDKNAQPPKYQLKDFYVPDYTYNADELPSNHVISYQIDSTDMNTMQNYQGNIYQVICQPKVVNYRPFCMFKNLVQADIPFARATTKTALTWPEQITSNFLTGIDFVINSLISVVNTISAIANSITGFLNKVIKALKLVGIKVNWQIKPIGMIAKVSLGTIMDNRIGMMLLSSDHFNVPKILILKEGSASQYNKIDPSNDGWDAAYKVQTLANAMQHAQAMWNKFYYVNSFIPASLNPAYADRPYGNQYRIQDISNVPFTWNDFNNVFANNRIMDAAGNPAILESLKFNPYKQKADMRVRFQQIFTLNLAETFLNPSGA